MPEKMTPMMQQYLDAKSRIPADAVLLFRLGDFYEEFFEDATKVSAALDIVMTKRQGLPMCGFPYKALSVQLPKLLAAGYKVAIADQMEDPKLAEGKVVKREITRIITPGTMVDDQLLAGDRNNYLAAVCAVRGGGSVLSALEVSTGEFFFIELATADQLCAELSRLGVREALIPGTLAKRYRESGGLPDPGHQLVWTETDDYDFDFHSCESFLLNHFGIASLDVFGCRSREEAVSAAGAVLRYAIDNLRHDAGHVRRLERRSLDRYLELDRTSLRNLEIIPRSQETSKDATLFGVLNKCSTSMGTRRLRTWVQRPLLDHAAIVARLDVVDALLYDRLTLAELRETLSVVRDVERIAGRLAMGGASPRDLVAMASSLDMFPGIRAMLSEMNVPLMEKLLESVGDFSEMSSRISATIVDEPPLSPSEGGVVRQGVSEELDNLRSAASNGRNWLAEIQKREIERTGIKSLKVKYNTVFGYYIEVSKANLSMVPQDYVRKQTLVNAERFITSELKDLEGRILGADEKARSTELAIFSELRDYAKTFVPRLLDAADSLASIDALASLAECARLGNYVRPGIFDDDRLVISGGRHPVLEQLLPPGTFVPNDCDMDCRDKRMMLITGPNMAGKSTYIRQVALLVIMAQIGSFVPADSAEIGLVDRIYTRIGAADDLSRSQSTFMVEMIETAGILVNATARSLVVLDEIGRGTSTFDGLSIAWSVAEYLHDVSKCRSLFATHYHELTALPKRKRGIGNFNIEVREYGDDIIFLRRIVLGACDRSYGIHVARLAGVPKPVLDRAKEVLETLESGERRQPFASKGSKNPRQDDDVQPDLF
ncbi:MAG: DNA mismatch repair protein MutS [Victivallaceae bacterium]|nr:DNA mismatch repair protein MutS [Victivallaceae bacterium]